MIWREHAQGEHTDDGFLRVRTTCGIQAAFQELDAEKKELE
jgi:hypothetical protein